VKTTLRDKKHLFFDLDHTLWDFDRNAEETLHELFISYNFSALGFSSASIFIETYTRNNHRLWREYHSGNIDKSELRNARFAHTFNDLGVEPTLFPPSFEEDYIRICASKPHLFPHALETLAYLQKRYKLHLISNGFKESSETKIFNTGIHKFFSHIVISETIGVHKPDPAIFQHALAGARASKEESIMIGDSLEADIRGALSFGMDAIFFNPKRIEVPSDIESQIFELKALMDIF